MKKFLLLFKSNTARVAGILGSMLLAMSLAPDTSKTVLTYLFDANWVDKHYNGLMGIVIIAKMAGIFKFRLDTEDKPRLEDR